MGAVAVEILELRPIRIGDTVEIDGISGIVRRIGARSSAVLTAQGAEVIPPTVTFFPTSSPNGLCVRLGGRRNTAPNAPIIKNVALG